METTSPPSARSTVPRRALTVLAAAVADLAVWAVAHLALGVQLTVRLVPGGPAQEVEPVTVGVVAVLAGCSAWALVALLERISRRPGATWIAISLVVLALSLIGPLGSGQTAAAIASLASMHLVTAAVLVPLMLGSMSRR